jgi:hypothetical protein
VSDDTKGMTREEFEKLFQDPDEVCQSEYRGIWDVLDSIQSQGELTLQAAQGITEEFINQAYGLFVYAFKKEPLGIHALMQAAGINYAKFSLENDPPNVKYIYVAIDADEFQLFRKGDQPTNYTVREDQ